MFLNLYPHFFSDSARILKIDDLSRKDYTYTYTLNSNLPSQLALNQIAYLIGTHTVVNAFWHCNFEKYYDELRLQLSFVPSTHFFIIFHNESWHDYVNHILQFQGKYSLTVKLGVQSEKDPRSWSILQLCKHRRSPFSGCRKVSVLLISFNKE